MSFDREVFTREGFKAAQQPHAWLSAAEKLAAAAELIMSDQVRHEVPYFRAYENAQHEALSYACASPGGRESPRLSMMLPTICLRSCFTPSRSKTC